MWPEPNSDLHICFLKTRATKLRIPQRRPEQIELLSLGAVLVKADQDKSKVRSFLTYVKPNGEINATVTRKHHISKNNCGNLSIGGIVRNWKTTTIDKALERFFHFLRESRDVRELLIVTHGIDDRFIFCQELQRHQRVFYPEMQPIRFVDSLSLLRVLRGDKPVSDEKLSYAQLVYGTSSPYELRIMSSTFLGPEVWPTNLRRTAEDEANILYNCLRTELGPSWADIILVRGDVKTFEHVMREL